MKKVLFGIVGLVILLVAAVLIGPGLIDWNAYKAEIAAQAKAVTGRDLTIDGDIRITVLPAPALVASDVGFANIKSASAPEMIRLKSLEIRIAPGPLLGGQIEVETIRLVEPEIELEVLADGRRNWDFTVRDEVSPATAGTAPAPTGGTPAGTPAAPEQAGAAAPAPSVRLDSFVIVDGSLVYRDAKGGTVERIDGINAEIAAASLSGPFDSAGRLVARGYPLTYEVSIGQIIHGRTVPFNLRLGLATDETTAQVAGTLVSLTEVPKFKGTVKAEGKQLAAFARAVAGAGPLPGFLAQPFSVEGAVVASAAGAEVKDLVIGLGEVKATGSVSAKLDKIPDITAELDINRIDLDKWLAMPPAKAPAPKGAKSAKGAGKTAPAPATPPAKAKAGSEAAQPAPFALPANINASLKLAAEVVTYRGEVVRQARLNAELGGGEVTISQLSTQLPGGSNVAVFGVVAADKGQPRFDGEAEISVGDLRAVLGWLGTELPQIPSGRLRRLTLATKITATPEQLQATDVDLQVDSSRLTGGLTVALQGRPSFGADVVLDRVNLDAYLPPPTAAPAAEGKPEKTQAAPGDAKTSPETKAPAAAEDARDAMAGWRLLQAFDANLKAHVKTLVFHQTSIKDVVFDGTLFDDKLEIRRASIAKLAGASALVSGTLAGLGGIPELKDLRFEGGGKDLTRLFAMTGVEPPVPPKNLGTVAIKGRADGPLYKPVLDVSLRAAEAQVGLKGTVALLPPRLDVSLTAKHKDLPRLMRVLGIDYRPAKRLGGLDIATTLKGDPSLLFFTDLKGTVGPVTFDGNATVGLDRPRPWFTADLTTGDIVIDRFLPAQRTALLRLPGMVPWRQAEPGIHPVAWRSPTAPSPPSLLRVIAAKKAKKERWSRDPIDLQALHAVNADVKLRSTAVAFDKYRLENADLALALSDGILHANRLAGVLFGGQVQGTATVRAATVPVVEANLGLKGMDVNKAGRALTGKPLATGAVDFDVKLGATGRSVADMVSVLQGNGAFALRNLDPKAGAKGTAMAAALNLVVGLNRLGGKKKKGGGLADVTGTFTVERGIARSDDLRLVSDAGDGQAKGSVDLLKWLIDVAGEVRLSQNLAAQLLAATAEADPAAQVLPFQVKGPLDAPNVKLDTARLQGGGIKIPGVDKLLKKKKVKKLLEKKGIGDVLQKFLPGQALTTQPPASTPGALPPPPGAAPLPPPPGTTPPPAAQPAPPPAQPTKPKPKDLLKGLLKGLGG